MKKEQKFVLENWQKDKCSTCGKEMDLKQTVYSIFTIKSLSYIDILLFTTVIILLKILLKLVGLN